MLIGGGPKAPASAEAAVEGMEGVASAAGVAADVMAIAKRLSALMNALKTIVEGLTKIHDLALKIMHAANRIASAGHASGAPDLIAGINGLGADTGGADLSDTTAWDVCATRISSPRRLQNGR